MNVLILGATGMLGQGALRESLADSQVKRVVTLGRSPTGQQHPKLRELVCPDLLDLSRVTSELSGLDACFFCLGVSSAGMSEAEYTRVTYDIAMSVGNTLVTLNPNMTFVFVSGLGADATERGRVMWARVKGRAENALRRLPFKAVYVIRPAFILPLHGIKSRTAAYRFFYSVTRPFYPLFKMLMPRYVTTTERLGQAMLALARSGYSKPILETADVTAVLERQASR